MARQIHAVVQYASDFNRAVRAEPVQDEMPRLADLSDSATDPLPGVDEMIRSGSGGNLRPAETSCSFGLIGDVRYRPGQKRFIPENADLLEALDSSVRSRPATA